MSWNQTLGPCPACTPPPQAAPAAEPIVQYKASGSKGSNAAKPIVSHSMS